jgi:4-hydroxy-tetrahydrodipicolinate reductase
MGRFVARAVADARDMALVAVVDPAGVGHTLGEILATDDPTPISGHLAGSLQEHAPDVMVDFTVPSVVMSNLEAALTRRVPCVVGTTGFSHTDLQVVAAMCDRNETPCVIAPNFSIGANLMMLFAAQAAPRFDYAEIIERHHEGKVDSPSGTAMKTAEMMAQAREGSFVAVPTEVDKAPGSRGGVADSVTIHAVRMPGYVADQEVVLGGLGERLVISHVSISRECFMPGVLLAIRCVRERSGLTHGLEYLLT